MNIEDSNIANVRKQQIEKVVQNYLFLQYNCRNDDNLKLAKLNSDNTGFEFTKEGKRIFFSDEDVLDTYSIGRYASILEKSANN